MNKNKYPEIPDNARLSDMLLLANVFSKTMSQELKHYDEQIEKMEFQEGMQEFFSGMLNMFIKMSDMNSELMEKCLTKVKEEKS